MINKQKGFSLVEQLITFVIISFAVIGVVKLQAVLAGTELLAKQRAEALSMTEQAVENLRRGGYFSTAANNSSSVQGKTALYTVSTNLNPVTGQLMDTITASTQWTTKGENNTITLVSLLASTSNMDTGRLMLADTSSGTGGGFTSSVNNTGTITTVSGTRGNSGGTSGDDHHDNHNNDHTTQTATYACSCVATDAVTAITQTTVMSNDYNHPSAWSYSRYTSNSNKCSTNGGCSTTLSDGHGNTKVVSTSKGDYLPNPATVVVTYNQISTTVTTGATWGTAAYTVGLAQPEACTQAVCAAAATKCTPANTVATNTAVGDSSSCNFNTTVTVTQ